VKNSPGNELTNKLNLSQIACKSPNSFRAQGLLLTFILSNPLAILKFNNPLKFIINITAPLPQNKYNEPFHNQTPENKK